MIIDLHIHSTESDGECTPKEIVQIAKKNNLDIIALSDHDTGSGIEEAIKEGKKLGIKVIPAIEFTANDESVKKMHILGYNIDYKNKELQDIYKKCMKDVERKNAEFLNCINKIGANISFEDISKICKSKNIRKPVFAEILLEKGYVSNKEEVYEKYFFTEEFKNIKRENTDISPKEVIEIINRFGGKAILAHPYSLGLRGLELENKIDELMSYGLKGMECFHSRQSNEQMIVYEKIAKDRNLIISKGSDFHGLNIYKDIYIGNGKFNNIKDISIKRLNKIEEIIKLDIPSEK